MDVLLARQPIFDRRLQVFGYELLYRGTMSSEGELFDGDRATSEVILNSFQIFDIDVICSDKKAFINFTQNLLKEELPSFLSNEKVIIEILEDVEVDNQVIAACAKLKSRGYILALDDFVFENLRLFNEVLPFVDIIKVDFMETEFCEVKKRIMKVLSAKNKKFLAEKVETPEQYKLALELGFEYFQGYFFEKPYVLVGKDVDSYKISYLQMMAEIQDTQNFDTLADIVNRDVGMTYKLLRLINSPFYGRGNKITSSKQALVMLGLKEVKKWLTLLMMRETAKEKPDELMRISLTRAGFAERVSKVFDLTDRKSELFLMGMFSTLDAVLDKPMEEIVQYIPFEDDILEAYQPDSDSIFRKILLLTVYYEKGDWDFCDQILAEHALNCEVVNVFYLDALQWADQIMQSME